MARHDLLCGADARCKSYTQYGVKAVGRVHFTKEEYKSSIETLASWLVNHWPGRESLLLAASSPFFYTAVVAA